MPKSGVTGCMLTICLTLCEVAKSLSKVIIPVYTPTAIYESSTCTVVLPTVDLVSLSYFCHSIKCVLASHGFNLHFSNSSDVELLFGYL